MDEYVFQYGIRRKCTGTIIAMFGSYEDAKLFETVVDDAVEIIIIHVPIDQKAL